MIHKVHKNLRYICHDSYLQQCVFVGSIWYRPILLYSPPSHSPRIQLISFFPPFLPILLAIDSFPIFTPLSLTPYHQLSFFPPSFFFSNNWTFSYGFHWTFAKISKHFHNTFITRSSHFLLAQHWLELPSTPIALLSHFHGVKVHGRYKVWHAKYTL